MDTVYEDALVQYQAGTPEKNYVQLIYVLYILYLIYI